MTRYNALGTPWRFKEIPGKLGLVYVVEVGGMTYRIAPDRYMSDKWRIDALTMLGASWEAADDIKYSSPEAAAKALVQMSRNPRPRFAASGSPFGQYNTLGTRARFKEIPGKLGRVYMIEKGGQHYRIAPEHAKSDKWRIDVASGMTLMGAPWEAATDAKYSSPEQAAKALLQLPSQPHTRFASELVSRVVEAYQSRLIED